MGGTFRVLDLIRPLQRVVPQVPAPEGRRLAFKDRWGPRADRGPLARQLPPAEGRRDVAGAGGGC